MKKLYFQMYVAVLASLVLSNIISFSLNDTKWKDLKSQDAIAQTQGIEKLILREVETGQIQIDNAIPNWLQEFGYDLSIAPINTIGLAAEGKQELINRNPFAIITHQGWRTQYDVYRPLSKHNRILHISWLDSSNPEYDILAFLNLTIPFGIIAIAVFFLVKPIRKNLNHLVEISESYALGNFEPKVDLLPPPFDHLSTTLSKIASRMMQVVEEQNKFSSSITHELRTPLAKLRLALDLTRNIHSTIELRNHISEMDADVDELEAHVTELLSYAHFSSEESIAKFEELEVTSLLIGLAKRIEPLNANVKIETCTTGDQTSVHADPFMLRQAISNLLTNAQRYAKSVIKINVRQTSSSIEIWIEDDGPGIPSHLKQSIFQPFYRFTRDEHDRGYGLGLAIVQRIMEKHGGDVLAAKSILGGANFKLKFPVRIPEERRT